MESWFFASSKQRNQLGSAGIVGESGLGWILLVLNETLHEALVSGSSRNTKIIS